MIYPLNPPLAELLLLSIISQEDSYGYIISQRLKTVSNLKDSALYPMLKRLSDQNYVEIYDQQFQGRNRKYYRITPMGETQRANLLNEWKSYCNEIEAITQKSPREQSEEPLEGSEQTLEVEGGKDND
ncbi:MAG TPA: PadR family transcriptional regulator [Lachnospiraceae bacterium]|jgi:PadR family transcriptional regulator, regulatory protein PadR|nr:PadR family transcriptional regulator [Lachnospiraceae bacterium]